MRFRDIVRSEFRSVRDRFIVVILKLAPDTFLSNSVLRVGIARLFGMRCSAGCYLGRGYYFRPWNMSVGEGTHISSGCHFDSYARVEVGSNVSFGPGVLVITSTHDYGQSESRRGALIGSQTTVGDGSWIGARVVVGPGVTIGAGTVVSAGSVLLRTLPPDTLVAGNPARVIRHLSDHQEKETVSDSRGPD